MTEKVKLALIRRPEVERRTGLSRSAVYAALKRNLFPKPVQLGPMSIAWVESEVEEWIANKIKESRKL